MYDNNQMSSLGAARRHSINQPSGPPGRIRPRGPPPTSPYGMINTPPSRHGSSMNMPASQRGPMPPGSGPLQMSSRTGEMTNRRGPPPRRGPIPRGPPPKGPLPNGPPPRNLPHGGTPGRSPNLSSRMDYPNTGARVRPGSASSGIQGE